MRLRDKFKPWDVVRFRQKGVAEAYWVVLPGSGYMILKGNKTKKATFKKEPAEFDGDISKWSLLYNLEGSLTNLGKALSELDKE